MTTTDAAPTTVAADLLATRPTRWGAWMLTLSPLGFVAVVASTASTLIGSGIGLFTEITRAQMDAIAFGWAVQNILYSLAILVGIAGTILLAGSLARRGDARVPGWASVTTAVASGVVLLPYAPLRIAAAGFAEPTLGQNPLYSFWDTAFYVSWYLMLASLLLLCVTQWLATSHRTSAIVVGALTVVVTICFAAGLELPPFVVSFLWCALGIVWLRALRRRRKTAATA